MIDMEKLVKAADPFRFYTRFNISELIGLRASNLWQMLHHIKKIPASCVYHHTHRFLQQRQYLSPEPSNDFAYWVSNALGEKRLGEQLASVDAARFNNIESLRSAFIEIIDRHLNKNFLAGFRNVEMSEALYFIKSVSFILPTPYVANNLKEFIDILKNVTTDSVYFHTFEARMRLERETNDFSNWLKNSLSNEKLADEIARLDPYTYTLEELRAVIIKLVERHIGG